MNTVNSERAKRVKPALTAFSITAYVTGVMLLILCVEMIYKYLILDPGDPTPAFLKTIAIVHGWCYMAFLLATVNLGMKARWEPSKWIITALGGVVPFLSFIVESKRRKEVKAAFGLA